MEFYDGTLISTITTGLIWSNWVPCEALDSASLNADFVQLSGCLARVLRQHDRARRFPFIRKLPHNRNKRCEPDASTIRRHADLPQERL